MHAPLSKNIHASAAFPVSAPARAAELGGRVSNGGHVKASAHVGPLVAKPAGTFLHTDKANEMIRTQSIKDKSSAVSLHHCLRTHVNAPAVGSIESLRQGQKARERELPLVHGPRHCCKQHVMRAWNVPRDPLSRPWPSDLASRPAATSAADSWWWLFCRWETKDAHTRQPLKRPSEPQNPHAMYRQYQTSPRCPFIPSASTKLNDEYRWFGPGRHSN